MARSLGICARRVPTGEREQYLRIAASRRDAHKAAGCNFWIFERDGDSEGDGASLFVEFIETTDPAGYDAAATRDRGHSQFVMYHETVLPASTSAA